MSHKHFFIVDLFYLSIYHLHIYTLYFYHSILMLIALSRVVLIWWGVCGGGVSERGITRTFKGTALSTIPVSTTAANQKGMGQNAP